MGFNDEFRDRTKKFALRIIKLYQSLPKTEEARIIGKQLLRSGTSIGANYRSATKGRSEKEFISKLSISNEEADETCYWIELLIESQIIEEGRLKELYNESVEISKILAVSRKTLLNKSNASKKI
jgi:four helix bundle protein